LKSSPSGFKERHFVALRAACRPWVFYLKRSAHQATKWRSSSEAVIERSDQLVRLGFCDKIKSYIFRSNLIYD